VYIGGGGRYALYACIIHADYMQMCVSGDVAITVVVRAESSLNIFTYYLKMQNILLFIIAHFGDG